MTRGKLLALLAVSAAMPLVGAVIGYRIAKKEHVAGAVLGFLVGGFATPVVYVGGVSLLGGGDDPPAQEYYQ